MLCRVNGWCAPFAIFVLVLALLPKVASADVFYDCLNEINADVGIPACEAALEEGLTSLERADVFLALGLYERKSGDYDSALKHLGEASALKIDNSVAMTEIGLIHHLKGDHESAVAAYSEALAFRPDYVRALNNRAVAMISLGQVKRAIDDYNQALTIDTNDADIWNNRANAFCKIGAVDDAYRDRIEALYQGRFTAAAAQSGLRKSGYYSGPSDGIWGPDSEDALLDWTRGGCPNAPKTRLN